MNKNAGQFDLYHLLSREFFAEDNCLPTVTVLPICDDHIGLISPVQVADARWFVLPQGSIREGDGTVMCAALRVLDKTLGLRENDYENCRISPLLRFDDPIPEGRPDAGKWKRHHVVGVRVVSPNRFIPNHETVKGNPQFAKNPNEFLTFTELVARKRPTKHKGLVESVREACRRRLLRWQMELPSTAVMAQ